MPSLFNYLFNINAESQSQETLNTLSGARDVPDYPISTFFSETTLDNQVEADNGGYGPVPEDLENKFRITSVFNTTSAKKVFAPFAGRILIQPSPDNEKVNVLIKPLSPISGLKVKYFIFRGLRDSDFFESTIKVRKLTNATNPTAFLTKVWTIFNHWNPGQEDYFHPKFLGYDLGGQNLTDNIEKEFYKSSELLADRPFEYFTVQEGEWIGNFDSTLGIDIVLDNGDYVDNSSEFKFDLEFLRKGEIVLDLNDYADDYKKKQIREGIFHFIDPAAFYGFHFENGTVHISNGTSSTPNTGANIYNNVISKFINRNKVYFYLKSNKNRSYNYYKNYTLVNNLEIKVGATQDDLDPISYLTSSWPVLIYENAQTNSEAFNKLFLKLICDDDGVNDTKMYYNLIGNLQGADKDGNWAYGLKKSICDQGQTYTNPIEYQFSNIEISNQKYFISNIVFALYIGKDLPILSEPPNNSDSIKDYFSLMNSDFLFSNDVPVIEEQFANNQFFKSEETYKQLINTKYIVDGNIINNKIAIETLVSDYDLFGNSDASFQAAYAVNKSVEKKVKKSSFIVKKPGDNFYELNSPYFINREKITVDGGDLICLSGSVLDDRLFKKYLLGFTKELKDEVFNYIETNHLTNISVYLKFDSIITYDISNAEKKCYKYQFKITGENTDNEYVYIDFNPSNVSDANVYSLDKHVFFTKKYTQDIPESIIDSLIEFQSLEESSLVNLTKRLVSTVSNPNFHLLFDLNGFEVNYGKNEKDPFGLTLSNKIQIPVGTKVIHIGDSKNNINGILMAYVVFYHNNKFREGFIDKNALGSPNVRIKSQDVISNSNLHADCFLDDAGVILKYNQFILENPYSKASSKEFVALINETNLLYNQLISSVSRGQLNTKLVTLFDELNNVSSSINLLPIPNNRVLTSQKYMNFEPIKRLGDIDMGNNGKYLLLPVTNLWIETWRDTDSAFGIFLNTDITITVEGNSINYKYQDLVGDSYQPGNGQVTRDIFVESYAKLVNFLKQLRLHLLGRPVTDAISLTPEAQWLMNLPESELTVYTKYIAIDEKDDTVDGLPFNIWYNQNLKNIGFVAVDDSIGYLNSATCLSLFIHEMNTQSLKNMMLLFDTHSFEFKQIDTDYRKMVSLLRMNESCVEFFDYFNIVAQNGNWLSYITSFHKSILYLNYYIKKLLL